MGLNKFGRTTNAASGTLTDIWDGADTATNQPIWLAPTAARTHALVSTQAADAAAGTGANTVRVQGLKTWSSAETAEVVTLNGTTPVNTANSYVIIHRMKLLTWGSGGTNAGVITATAATDSTITAMILAGEGQTQMAIYGVPSGKSLYMSQYYGSVNKNVKTAGVDIQVRLNPSPDVLTTGFLVKHTKGLVSEGTGDNNHLFDPYWKIEGPAIVKVQCTSDTASTVVDGGFDGYIE
jgi:hypothetical protein